MKPRTLPQPYLLNQKREPRIKMTGMTCSQCKIVNFCMTGARIYSPGWLRGVAALCLSNRPPLWLSCRQALRTGWLARSPLGAQVAACHHGLDVSKRWLFLSNQPSILDLASICQHPPSTHKNIWGRRAADGTFVSRLTAEYPESLALGLATGNRCSRGRLSGPLCLLVWRTVLDSAAPPFG